MTKKHFESLALDIKESGESVQAKAFAARIIIRTARADNPRFDVERFLRACGLDVLCGA